MRLSESLAIPVLHRLNTETACHLGLSALRCGLGPRYKLFTTSRLRTKLAGLDLPNPIGLAAGFDKNAIAMKRLMGVGFGFSEFGTVTPQPQYGNLKPRLFRLKEDHAFINRFGFNSIGAEAIAKRLQSRPKDGILGINLGANTGSTNIAKDYIKVLQLCAPYADFATINISCPNVKNLGDQDIPAMLEQVMDARKNLKSSPKIFLKIGADLTKTQIAFIAKTAIAHKIDGIITTNTTVDRANLASGNATEKGGLSGQPLFKKSTRVLARLARETGGEIPLIGVGGVSNAAQAFAKIQAGATAVQLYSALVYGGLGLIEDIAKGLDILLTEHGYDTIEHATGSAIDKWL